MADDEFEPLAEGYQVEPYDGQHGFGDDALVAMWLQAGVLSPEEATRRVREVVLVATFHGELAGVATAYVQTHPQLRMPLWNGRVFVTPEHRRSELATNLAARSLSLLRERYTSGIDTRGGGMIFEVESGLLKRGRPQARWTRTGFTFVGLNAIDAHVRVVYFPGVLAPTEP